MGLQVPHPQVTRLPRRVISLMPLWADVRDSAVIRWQGVLRDGAKGDGSGASRRVFNLALIC